MDVLISHLFWMIVFIGLEFFALYIYGLIRLYRSDRITRKRIEAIEKAFEVWLKSSSDVLR